MSIYDTLLGAPTDQDKMAAIARRLRGQEALGTLATFSGDPIMAPWGQQQMEQIPQRVEQLQRSVLPMATGNPDFYRVGTEIRPYLTPEERERRAQIAHQRDIEVKEAGARAATEQFKARQRYQGQFMPQTDWRKVAEPISQAQFLVSLIPEIEKSPDIAQPLADVGAETLRELGLGKLVTLLEPKWKSGEARSLRSALDSVISQLRHSIFGAALTDFERIEFGRENPSLAGLDKATLVDRMKRYGEFIRGKVMTHMGGQRPPEGVEAPPLLGWDPVWTPQTAGGGTPSSGTPAIPAAVPGGAGATGDTGLPAGWRPK